MGDMESVPLVRRPDAGQIKTSEAGGALNGPQKLKLRVSCHYIDKLLSDVESILHAATSRSPFGKYIADVTPAQTRALEDHIHRIRGQLLRSLAWQGMAEEAPTIPATRAMFINLSFIDIAVEELRPRYMRGSGAVSEEAASELNGVVHELRSLLQGMERYLRQEMGTSLDTRLQRLQDAGAEVGQLQSIAEIANRHGLIEFRGRIEALTARLEDPSFEIALFGRVSSGKSSLLNALLGMDILPVGVNPITAVPTRLRSGPKARAAIAHGNGESEIITLDDLARFVTEEGNPGNQRNVVRAVVEAPSPRLAEGIVLVDTPGLGSLARRGARETLAYLPSADLGLLLVDAGATLSEEDIGTLRLLYEAGIPPLVLLSKADQLGERDLPSAMAYIEEHLQRELGVAITVHPVSALPSHAALLDRFYEQELLPRFTQARCLRDESVARKTGALKRAVIAAMETILDSDRRRGGAQETYPDRGDLESLEARLRLVVGEVGEQPRLLERDLLGVEEAAEPILSRVAEQALAWTRSSEQTVISALQISEWIHRQVEEQLQPPIQRLRAAGERALNVLAEIAQTLHASDAPSVAEADSFFRDLPRFELALLPEAASVSHWRLLGDKVAVSRIRSGLRDTIGGGLRDELRAYGRALHQWTQQAARRLERLVSSYADSYRLQIQRSAGTAEDTVDADQLRRDLASLLRGKEASAPAEAGQAVA